MGLVDFKTTLQLAVVKAVGSDPIRSSVGFGSTVFYWRNNYESLYKHEGSGNSSD